jgi:hypothetical protein
MRVRQCAVGNQRARAEQVVRCRDVVPGFVPIVGKAQQRQVRKVQRDKDQRKDQPQRKMLVLLWIGPWIGPFIGFCSLSSEEGNDGCLRQG